MILPPKNQEKLPELPKVLIPTRPERNLTTNVNPFVSLVPPKNQKETEEKKKNEKAN